MRVTQNGFVSFTVHLRLGRVSPFPATSNSLLTIQLLIFSIIEEEEEDSYIIEGKLQSSQPIRQPAAGKGSQHPLSVPYSPVAARSALEGLTTPSHQNARKRPWESPHGLNLSCRFSLIDDGILPNYNRKELNP